MLKKILWPIYIGFIVYSLLTLVSGGGGLSNMKALNYFKLNLVNHIDSLNMKNIKLEDEIDRLASDVDRLKLAGRPLGYIEPGQSVIKILNSHLQKSLYEIDHQYEVPEFKENSSMILLLSSLFSVIFFVFFLFVGIIRDTFK